MVNLKGLADSESYKERTFYMRPRGLYYLDTDKTGALIEGDSYATQKYVDSKITDAITASY